MAMETKPPQTEITFGENKENPFHNDLLNRKQEIMDLTPMIKRIKSPAVMALYAPWGAGKTAFIKMWAAYLNKEQIPAAACGGKRRESAASFISPVEAPKTSFFANRNFCSRLEVAFSPFVDMLQYNGLRLFGSNLKPLPLINSALVEMGMNFLLYLVSSLIHRN